MSDPIPAQSKARLKVKLNEYPKLTKSNARLFPYRNEIKILRARNAAYADIQLILAQENVVVSLNTLYRFCRDVLGEKASTAPEQHSSQRQAAAIESATAIHPELVPPQNLQAVLQERRERLPGLWGRQKRGPRIADSKNL